MAILKCFFNRHKFKAMVLIAVLTFLPLQGQSAGTVRLQENKIKAGLVYNFLKYTSWPEDGRSNNKDLQVCLLGGDSFGGALYPLSGRTAQQKTIHVREIDNGEVTSCNLVFINKAHDYEIENILSNLKYHSVLTLSDSQNFSRKGGMVEFSKEKDQRIHLVINNKLIKESGLMVEGRLLRLARVVE